MLTTEKIIIDLSSELQASIKLNTIAISIVFILLLPAALVALFNQAYIISAVIGIAFLIALLVCGRTIISSAKSLANSKAGDFIVTLASVTFKKPRKSYFSAYMTSPRLHFSNNSFFTSNNHELYQWSSNGSINAEKVYANADIGDCFYLVNTSNKSNIMIYSAKLFEPSGFTVDESHISEYLDSKSPE